MAGLRDVGRNCLWGRAAYRRVLFLFSERVHRAQANTHHFFRVDQEFTKHQTSCGITPQAVATNCVMEGLKHLKVRATDVPGVWAVRLPLILNHQAAKSERDSIVTTLLDKLPFSCLVFECRLPPDRELWWSFPTKAEILSTLESLYEGGWVLFFFDHNPAGLATNIDAVPTDGNGVLKLCDSIGSRTAIVSWFDDQEWIVADRTGTKSTNF